MLQFFVHYRLFNVLLHCYLYAALLLVACVLVDFILYLRHVFAGALIMGLCTLLLSGTGLDGWCGVCCVGTLAKLMCE